MKQYKVYLNDLDYITLTDANNKLTDKGMIKSNIIFYDKVKFEDLEKIRTETFWYLVNENLQERIDKALEYIEDIPALIWNEANEFGYSFDKLLDILEGKNE